MSSELNAKLIRELRALDFEVSDNLLWNFVAVFLGFMVNFEDLVTS